LTEAEVKRALESLVPLLQSEESFVYMNIILVIRELANHQLKLVIVTLVSIFAGNGGSEGNTSTNDSSLGNLKALPKERRVMASETLVQILGSVRNGKSSFPARHQQTVQMLPVLVQVCLKLARDRPLFKEGADSGAFLDKYINLQSMRVTAGDSSELEVLGSEELKQNQSSALRLEQSLLSLQAMPQSSSQELTAPPTEAAAARAAEAAALTAAASLADAVILRQAAVSLLCEAVATAGAAAAAAQGYLGDIVDVALAVLSLEQQADQASRAARR
jgi:hypothetical protein